MNKLELTERQLREREYYEEFCKKAETVEVCFDPVLGKEKRPWNPYWFVYETALQNFKNDDQKLLDFGCGNGTSSIVFSKIGYEVYGFDISETNIALAEKLAKKYKFGYNTHFSVQIAERLNYPSDFFDVITGIDILHHIEIKSTVKECHRLLRKGGIAIFREPIEAPIFDRMRNSKFGRWLVPKNKSFDRHITEDERKLTKSDLSEIKRIFPNIVITRFNFLSKIDPFIRRPGDQNPSFLEKVDYFLFRTFPFLHKLGGSAVLILRKENA